jgi:hypothetical protein
MENAIKQLQEQVDTLDELKGEIMVACLTQLVSSPQRQFMQTENDLSTVSAQLKSQFSQEQVPSTRFKDGYEFDLPETSRRATLWI